MSEWRSRDEHMKVSAKSALVIRVQKRYTREVGVGDEAARVVQQGAVVDQGLARGLQVGLADSLNAIPEEEGCGKYFIVPFGQVLRSILLLQQAAWSLYCSRICGGSGKSSPFRSKHTEDRPHLHRK